MKTNASRLISVPLLDLKAQYRSIKAEVREAIDEVTASQQFILGPKVFECERLIAEYTGASFACGVSSGTDALLAALMAEGIGPGDEVITSPFTFFGTAGSIHRAGAKPVFADILPGTFNLNPDLIEARISPRTKAVVPVHLFGQTADMDPLLAAARRYNLTVIEDAAQAIGAEYRGKRAGSLGHYGCLSFFPSKNLGAFGDAGMVVTSDAARIKKLKILRDHGAEPKYEHQFVGGNFRLDAIQAAVISVKLKYLDGWSQKRAANARAYSQLFEASGLASSGAMQIPAVKEDRHIFNQYVIRARKRDALKSFLAERRIATEIYYPKPLHLQECFACLGYKKGDFPESEKAAEEVLALPIYPELTQEQIKYVAGSIAEFYRREPS